MTVDSKMRETVLLDFAEAIAKIDAAVKLPEVVRLPYDECAGRVLAAPLATPRDIPAFTNSAMDGFAVLSADTAGASADAPCRLRILETIAAGGSPGARVAPGTCSAIMTGAPMPAGADAVVKVEETARRGEMVEMLSEVMNGKNVRFQGEEAKQGDALVRTGMPVSPAIAGLASSLGVAELSVWPPSRVALVMTGDEILPPGSAPQPGKILDAAGPALRAALERDGFPVVFEEYVEDKPAPLEAALEGALDSADVVLVVGGASMGEFDLVQDALRRLGVSEVFWKVAVKPGKPLWFGTRDDTCVFNVPGNPVSALVTYYLYVRYFLRRRLGHSKEEAALKVMTAKLGQTLEKDDPRLEFVRGIIKNPVSGVECVAAGERREPVEMGCRVSDIQNSKFKIENPKSKIENLKSNTPAVSPLSQRGSAMLSGMANANCLILFPRFCEKMDKGEKVTVFLLPCR